MSCLKIVGLNLDISWKNKDDNFSKIEKVFLDQEADVFLLPEMFSTGFCMGAEEIADRNEETLKWMISFAKDRGAAVAGSVSVFENGGYFNRFYFVKPDGDFQFYDKRHLFSYSGEDKIYKPGTERVIVDYKGFRILLQVCYDLRFPVWSRNVGNEYDLLIYVANWPIPRRLVWDTLLRARALENQCYVCGVNRVGIDGYQLTYNGGSRVYSAFGEEIGSFPDEKEGIATVSLNLNTLNQFREKFPVWKDADEFHL